MIRKMFLISALCATTVNLHGMDLDSASQKNFVLLPKDGGPAQTIEKDIVDFMSRIELEQLWPHGKSLALEANSQEVATFIDIVRTSHGILRQANKAQHGYEPKIYIPLAVHQLAPAQEHIQAVINKHFTGEKSAADKMKTLSVIVMFNMFKLQPILDDLFKETVGTVFRSRDWDKQSKEVRLKFFAHSLEGMRLHWLKRFESTSDEDALALYTVRTKAQPASAEQQKYKEKGPHYLGIPLSRPVETESRRIGPERSRVMDDEIQQSAAAAVMMALSGFNAPWEPYHWS